SLPPPTPGHSAASPRDRTRWTGHGRGVGVSFRSPPRRGIVFPRGLVSARAAEPARSPFLTALRRGEYSRADGFTSARTAFHDRYGCRRAPQNTTARPPSRVERPNGSLRRMGD